MSRVNKYLENTSIPGDDLIDTVTVSEAQVACQLQELETINKIKNLLADSVESTTEYVIVRLNELTKRLNKIKY